MSHPAPENEISYQIFENVTSPEELGLVGQAIVACITEAFGHEMPATEVAGAMKGRRVIVAMESGQKVIGFSSLHATDWSRPTRYNLSQYTPSTTGFSFGAGTVSQEHQGKGIYAELNNLRAELVIAEKARFLTTTTQNPAVEKGIKSCLERFIEQGQLVGYRLEKTKIPGFYGRRLTNYELNTQGTEFAELDIEAGDAFALVFHLSYGDEDVSPSEVDLNEITPAMVWESFIQLVNHKSEVVEEIPPNQIVTQVMNAVSQAKTDLMMTMHLQEELTKPTPHSYHELVSRKLEEGIEVTRFGFGTTSEYVAIANVLDIDNSSYQFIHNADITDYRRCILIDDKKLFFKINDVFYSTTDQELIILVKQYLNSV
jgi:hypothetical protein